MTYTAGGGIPPQTGTATSITSGRKSVAAAGTQEILLTAGTQTKEIVIRAILANTSDVYVGDSSVSNITGITLQPGESIVLNVDHSSAAVYVDVAVNGEGVEYIALN